MEYLILSEECLGDKLTVNGDMSVTLEDGDEQDVIAIPLQYIEQINIAEESECTYVVLIKSTTPASVLQRLMYYAAKSSANESYFILTFDLAYMAFK